jgi:DNA primase large subunit
VSEEERNQVAENLLAATPALRRVDEDTWYKVDWEKVAELVERRSVFMKRGKAYVPGREQLSMIMAEFTARLERSLEVWFAWKSWFLHSLTRRSSQAEPYHAWMRMTA